MNGDGWEWFKFLCVMPVLMMLAFVLPCVIWSFCRDCLGIGRTKK